MQMPDVRTIKPGRINCGGLLSCGRTFDAEKNQGHTWIICGRCWRLLPAELRATHKRLNAQIRKWQKRAFRAREPDRKASIQRVIDRFAALQGKNSDAIAEFFRSPPRPIGLDAFLEEVGL